MYCGISCVKCKKAVGDLLGGLVLVPMPSSAPHVEDLQMSVAYPTRLEALWRRFPRICVSGVLPS